MKKKLVLIWLVLTMCALGACSQTETKETGSPESNTQEVSKETDTVETVEAATEETTPEEAATKETATKEDEPTVSTMSIKDFDKLLLELPVSVTDTKYVVQDEEYKTLYPDLLQAILQNNTEEDIKSAVVAFAAWDKNKLPVKIVGYLSFDDGSYVSETSYDDINLAAGSTFGKGYGLQLDENMDIDSFKAIVVSYETFEGDTWENPYYDEFCSLYEEKKFDKAATVDVKIEDVQKSSGKNTAKSEDKDADVPSEKELEALLAKEPVNIKSTKYVVQDEQYKSLYPDMLQAIIQNNTKEDIKNAVIAFAAWDKNGLPIKVKGYLSFDEGTYITKVDYSDINLAAGSTYGKDTGYQVDENQEIKTFKAIVVSTETFDGKTWENPQFDAFCSLYEGKKQK